MSGPAPVSAAGQSVPNSGSRAAQDGRDEIAGVEAKSAEVVGAAGDHDGTVADAVGTACAVVMACAAMRRSR
jgi:hypothetical protein